MMVSNNVEQEILEYLYCIDDEASTYKIAKELGISWSTINLNCYKLFIKKQIVSRVKPPRLIHNECVIHHISYAGRKCIGKVK